MTGPFVVGLLGSIVVVLGVLALRVVLRPVDQSTQPPNAEDAGAWHRDAAAASIFRILWRLVVVTLCGAGAQLAALVWLYAVE